MLHAPHEKRVRSKHRATRPERSVLLFLLVVPTSSPLGASSYYSASGCFSPECPRSASSQKGTSDRGQPHTGAPRHTTTVVYQALHSTALPLPQLASWPGPPALRQCRAHAGPPWNLPSTLLVLLDEPQILKLNH